MLAAHGEGGAYARWTVQSWIVRTYTLWDDRYRHLLEKSAGRKVQVDVFGDLRHMRNDIVHHQNDIVHHQGVTSKKNSGKVQCLASWVTVGEPLNIGHVQVAEFSRLVPWDELRAMVRPASR